MQMNNKYIKTITLSTFSLIIGFGSIQAQNKSDSQFGSQPAKDSTSKKMSVWEYLTKTPWVIQVGPDIVDDNDTRLKEFKIKDDRNYYPIHCSIEKRIKGKWGVQYVLSSETLNKHYFGSNDINVKYNILTNNIRDNKWFDPYVLAGFGHTYRDFPHGQHQGARYLTYYGYDNSVNFNVGAGANIWLFKNAGIYAQAIPKFNMFRKKLGGSNYIHFSVGFAWKIGSDQKPCVEAPLPVYKCTQEADDAAKYLRQILDTK